MKDYYIGYDIGTNSVGWAVTDENYKLMRAKGKDLWGVRLFSEAETAADRRIKRSNRRRYERRSQRLQLLREIFEEEILKIDKDFFARLDESFFYPEDKKIDGKYSLFNDKSYTDKEYFDEYPTIFHLRKELINPSEKKDIRLYFLVLNQMMKRRGHFLLEGEIQNTDDIAPFKKKIQYLLNDELNIDLELDFFDKIFSLLMKKDLNKTDKKKKA